MKSKSKAQTSKSSGNSNQIPMLLLILTVAAFGLYLGWREFWFLTDDSYIAFRYVSNSILGHGYVWNAEPFRPVEGYTSFLYVVMLDVIWRVLNVEPPDSANVLSLIFSFGSLVLVTVAVMKMNLIVQLNHNRLALVALVLFGLVTNASFLTWSSSGLETAMFNFLFLGWLLSAILLGNYGSRWRLAITTMASLVYLARPDGILIVASTILLLIISFVKVRKWSLKQIATTAPILVPFAHIIWRKNFYGEWLPNTYYAKYVAPWPEAGIRYLISFVIEYSVWIWVGILLVVIAAWIRRNLRSASGYKLGLGQILTGIKTQIVTHIYAIVIVLTVILHVAYYTFIVGGDHFEWRVYSHLAPLILLSSIYLLNKLNISSKRAFVILAVIIAGALPLPWIYHSTEKQYFQIRVEETLFIKVSDKVPFFVRPLANLQDNLQEWLTKHLVCVRWAEHKKYKEYVEGFFPKRTLRIPEGLGKYPVAAFANVGVGSWVFPNVNIIDGYGLNDYVIARHKVAQNRERKMAHDRVPPENYVDSYVPNVYVSREEGAQFGKRSLQYELTEEKIRALDKYWENKIVRGLTIPDSLVPLSARPL